MSDVSVIIKECYDPDAGTYTLPIAFVAGAILGGTMDSIDLAELGSLL